ncbi:MAG: membrane protein insertase YidC [Gammaproteobacteria bacterium]|nr:membrane protein insertase YidC [Gammaproteobacteria bacterium]
MRLINCLLLALACSSSNPCAAGNPAEPERHAADVADTWQEFQADRERHRFSGLASYYNGVRFYLVGEDILQPLKPGESFILDNGIFLAAVARFDVLLVQDPGLSLRLGERDSVIEDLKAQVEPDRIRVVEKSALYHISPALTQLQYAHLWAPLSELSKLVERCLIFIDTHTARNLGITIVIFTLLLKLLLFPVNVAIYRMQNEVGRIRSRLEPELTEIKASFDGEEAHNRIMAAHAGLGVTPFYSLRPLLGLMVLVPLWIAVFNALGEMPQFKGQSFLWIGDLAYPDIISVLPFHVPLLGSTVHLLPLIMAGVTGLSAWTLHNDQWSKAEYIRQRRNCYWMALAFLFLFYPFPAAMVLYWTLNNLLQIIVQLAVRTWLEGARR